jgi:hypothetical protein
VLAVLRCLDVEVPGDLDDLAVHRDLPPGGVYLRGGQGGQLAGASAWSRSVTFKLSGRTPD